MPSRRRFAAAMATVSTLSFLFVSPEIPAQEILWPLDLPKILTSTFGELRSTHFHAGLDLSTGGREGVPVHSVGDGKVYRLRASPFGYGKAIYQELSDGRHVVYAHLSNFSGRLRFPVEREQERLGRYQVDLWLPDPIPVRRNEIIGLSGSTGIGAPHLHLEFRNQEDEPHNPIPDIYEVPDTLPPIINAVWVIPAGEDTLVDGFPEPRRIPMTPGGPDNGYHGETVRAIGPFHLAIETSDRQGQGQHRLGIQSVSLESGQVSLYSVQFESFSYDLRRQVRAAYNYPIQVGTGRPCINLFDFSNPDRGALGVSNLDEDSNEAHRYRISVTDGAGNKSVAFLTVDPTSNSNDDDRGAGGGSLRGRSLTETLENSSSMSASMRKFHDRILVDLSLQESPDAPVRAEFFPDEGPPIQAAVFERDPRRFLVYLPTDSLQEIRGTLRIKASDSNGSTLDIPVRGDHHDPNESKTLTSVDDQAQVSLPGNTFFRRTAVYLEKSKARVRTSMEPLSPLFSVGPVTEPCANLFQIRIRSKDVPDPRAAIYRIIGGTPLFVARQEDTSTPWISARVDATGHYGVFLDNSLPTLRIIKPSPSIATTHELLEIELEADDRHSGIEADSIQVKLDKRRIICEYDPEEKRIFRELKTNLDPGEHRLEASVSDRAGNTVTVEKTFEIVEE